MDTTCLHLRGPPGSGKRHAIQTYLQTWARHIGQPFAPVKKIWDAPLGEQDEDDDTPADKSSQAGLPIEVSAVHWGFDVARMSLQDKKYIIAILRKWGRGGQVLSTNGAGSNCRCLVFYHAHLLSSESTLLLQAFLEMNYRDTVVWTTSEHPVPPRLADWFLEIPVKGEDKSLLAIQARKPVPVFHAEPFAVDVRRLLETWKTSVPTLKDVQLIRNLVYAFLHRNIRWCEGFHTFLVELQNIELPQPILLQALKICTAQPFTGPGQTVPSYRIPMLWENFLLLLRECLSRCVPVAPALTSSPQKKSRKKKGAAS
jgi:hypothetical protein